MKVSLGSWAFSFGPFVDRPIPFEQVARRAAQAGYDGLEISGHPPQVAPELYPTPASRRELAAFLRDLGLGVSGYAADWTLANPTIPGNRKRYLDLFRQNLQIAVDLGSPAMRVDSGAAPGCLSGAQYEAAFSRLADLWREAAELAQPAGVRLVWEFEPGFIFNKPTEIAALAERVDHPNFRILFDTCHAFMCAVVAARQHGEPETLPGGVESLLARLAGRIGAIHLADSDGSLFGDETSTHLPLGEGLIDFAKLAPKLFALPVEWWCVDLCFCEKAWELLEPSLGYVERLRAAHAAAERP
jgi:sugar phosphate isomerase/epimerase